jgi:hypothetical protein
MRIMIMFALMALVVLASLGWNAPGAAFAASLDEDEREEWRYEERRQDNREYQERSYRRGEDLPERYTIRKGKKCEVRCERRAFGRDFDCREYRC